MNPFRPPQTKPEEPDSSVLAVYESLVYRLLCFSAGQIGSAMAVPACVLVVVELRGRPDWGGWALTAGVLMGLLAAAGFGWRSSRRRLVFAIGANTLSVVGFFGKHVTVLRDDILSATWIDRWNEGSLTLVLRLSDSTPEQVRASPVWSRRSRARVDVEWDYPDNTLTHSQTAIGEVLERWLWEGRSGDGGRAVS